MVLVPLVVEAWVDLWRARIGLRKAPARLLDEACWAAGCAGVPESSYLERVTRGVELASALFVPPSTCLERSIAMRNILSRRGYRTELKIGVRRAAGSFEAHAWLEAPSLEGQSGGRGFLTLETPHSPGGHGT